jgi:hypothetical protein
MSQLVPEDDLPGIVVPEDDLPNVAVPEFDISTVTPPGQPMETPPTAGGMAPQLPVTGYGPGVGSVIAQTPLGQNVGRVMAPYATAGSKLMTQYANNPITKLAPDLIAAAHGVPPPFATSAGIGATQGAYNVARQTAASNKIPGPVSPTPQQIASNPMLAEMAARQAAADAENLANRSMIQKIAMSKVMQTTGKAVAPILNTAARVAGPAGLAYNAYEAGNMARDTQLGERLAQGQGGAAQQAFRKMNIPAGAGFNQMISQQQAQNIVASRSARDIQAFGGEEFLRRKALGQ